MAHTKITMREIREVYNESQSNLTHSTTSVSNVCRTMTLALFAAVIYDIWKTPCLVIRELSLSVAGLVMIEIFIELIQYCTTTILLKVWSYKIVHRRLNKRQLNKEKIKLQKFCLCLVELKVLLVLVCSILVVIILTKKFNAVTV